MWETLDLHEHALVRTIQDELWREAEMRQLARAVRSRRPTRFRQLLTKISNARSTKQD
jgi:hypothetical protein